MKLLFVFILFISFSACGTFSHLKPADPTELGQVDLTAGVAVNGVPEVVPVIQASVGVSSVLDVGAKYEVYNGYAWGRIIPFNSADHGFALALLGGIGFMSSFSQSVAQTFTVGRHEGMMVVVGATIGKRFEDLDLYAGYQAYLSLNNAPVPVQSVKGGGRLLVSTKLYLGLEGGVSFHSGVAVFEGAGSVGFLL